MSLIFKSLEFELLSKEGKRVRVEGSLSQNERVLLRGPSGCGKTTLLKVLAGLIKPSSGSLWLGSQDLTRLPSQKRNCSLVFQSGALFPHLNVLENVVFGLEHNPRHQTLSRSEKLDRARLMLERLSLAGFESREVTSLSGGEQQRVALARGLVVEPDYLLLDEPLTALDPENRKRGIEVIRSALELAPAPVLIVSHLEDESEELATKSVNWANHDTCLSF